MKRYLLFGYTHYYPEGGMNDLLFGFNTIDELEESLEEEFDYIKSLQIFHVMDTESLKMVYGEHGIKARDIVAGIKEAIE